jgi:ethanolamine ammonia-lyase large subunit
LPGARGPTAGFGIDLAALREAHAAALALGRGTVGRQRDVFRDRAGLRALRQRAPRRRPADHARRAPTPWRGAFDPLLVNTVVGFIGPEYLYDGKQIIRAGLEDHFCGKLLGLPMGCDVCYTNHAEADQDDMDSLLDAARRGRRAASSWACRARTT